MCYLSVRVTDMVSLCVRACLIANINFMVCLRVRVSMTSFRIIVRINFRYMISVTPKVSVMVRVTAIGMFILRIELWVKFNVLFKLIGSLVLVLELRLC